MISEDKQNRNTIIIFSIFLIFFEILHILYGDAPTLVLRCVYIIIYLFFCFQNVPLIPFFTVSNIILERFSIIYGEFLPNTLLFHIIVLLYCYLQLKRNRGSRLSSYNKSDLLALVIFSVYILGSALVYGNFSFFINIIFCILFLKVMLLSDDAVLNHIINATIFFSFSTCIFALINYDSLVSNYYTSLGYTDRLHWKDANYLSFFIGIMALITMMKLKYCNEKRYKIYYYTVLLISFIILFLLLSRGTLISLMLACAFYYKDKLSSIKIFKYIFILGIISYIFYISGLFDGIIMRMSSDDLENGSGRLEIWTTGLKTFFSKDWFTIFFGIGNDQAINMAFVDFKFFSPHNNFLEIFFNFGIFGLLLFLYLMGVMFFGTRNIEKRSIMFFVLINSLTIVPFTFVTPLWIIIALLFMWDERVSEILCEYSK